MKITFSDIIHGRSSIGSGIVAVTVVALIGLGCFCNKDKFDFDKIASQSSPSPSPTASVSASPSPSATKEYKKADASKYEVPGEDEMQDMAKTVLLDFNKAVENADFTEFHGKIAKQWQKNVSADDFKRSFQGFIDKNVDISNIKPLTAEWETDPAIDRSRGIRELLVKGSYDTSPAPVKFRLNFIPEGKTWKLYGIEIDTRR